MARARAHPPAPPGPAARTTGPPDPQALLAAIVDSSQDAIVSKTLDGIITSWNGGAERLFGWRADEAIGRSILLIIPPDRTGEEEHILARLKRGERVEHFETIRRRKDGSDVPLSLTISPVRDASGAIVGASKIARDISEYVRIREERQALLTRTQHAEAQLRELNAKLDAQVRERTRSLEESLRELDTFAYTVAHDLRAPLRAIHGFGQLLIEDAAGRLDEPERRYLTSMVAAAARMDRLILDLLEYSRVSREDIGLVDVDLDGVVAEVLDVLRPELEAAGASVHVARGLGRVLANRTTLVHVVLNLVDNAFKFVGPETAPEVRIRSEARGGYVRLWVEDNGIGIAPQYQDRIFRIFERLHRTQDYPGTGVGLAIVRRAVDRMGGRSGVESREGAGSRFFVELHEARPEAGIPVGEPP